MQTRRNSLLESCLNTGSGFLLAFITQILIFHHYQITVPVATNLKITVLFTVISVARGYLWRRFFTHRTEALHG